MSSKTIGYKFSIYGDFKLTWVASSKRGKCKATNDVKFLPKFGQSSARNM